MAVDLVCQPYVKKLTNLQEVVFVLGEKRGKTKKSQLQYRFVSYLMSDVLMFCGLPEAIECFPISWDNSC